LEYHACHIRIPKPDSENWGAEYIYDRHDKFCGFKIGQSTARTEVEPNYLALSVVRQFKTHDKLGNKILLRDFKDHYFGNRKARLTRELALQSAAIGHQYVDVCATSACAPTAGRITALRPTTQW
jgi:hypothetical protein